MLCLLLVGRRKGKKKKREKWPGFFSWGWWPGMPYWLCCMGFSQLLGAIKG
jgi:hypothetical protein